MEKRTSNLPSKEELEEQNVYINLAKEKLNKSLGRAPKAFVHTYGCQQNVSDSERMKGELQSMGYEFIDEPEGADLVLFNTCAVREHAEDRVWGNIGVLKKYKKANPDMLIIISGCMTQQEKNAERLRRSFPYVDIVLGTYSRWRLPEYIYKRISGSNRIFALEERTNDIAEGFPVYRDGSFKAWVPIMYGCNNFCTYCIVPYVRGRERSREPQKILQEVRELVSAGYKEITLLGQNVNSYGKGEEHGVNFSKLLRMINDIEGDFRIRFMTSHPRDCTKELLDAMRDCEKVCRHLHLPFQSGSDRILKAMNRHYDRASYLELIRYAKEIMPDISLSSDIIVGFPGETYEDFLETLSLVREVKYQNLFTFIYSPRNGTPAAELPDPVTRKEKGRWFSELLRVQEEISLEISKCEVGKTLRVLCEEEGRGEGTVAARSHGNTVVEIKGSPDMIGTFKTVKIKELTTALIAEIID